MCRKMSDFDAVERALALLRNSVSGFPIGALTPEDLKPIEEKIKDLRGTLKWLNSRIQMLKVETNIRFIPTVPESDYNQLSNSLRSKISETIITNQVTAICLQSQTTRVMLSDSRVDPEMRSKLNDLLVDLYTLNDMSNARHELLDSRLLGEQLQLKHDCVIGLIEFSDFLKEQERVRNTKLAQSNPSIVAKKQKLRKLLFKINIMKKLMTNFISAASSELRNHPQMMEMLRLHRDQMDIETLNKLSESSTDSSSDAVS